MPRLFLLVVSLLVMTVEVHAASVPLTWEAPPPGTEPLTGYQLQRCTSPVPTGAPSGPPVDIPVYTVRLVAVDSEETTCLQGQGIKAIDGNPQTFWHTQFCPTVVPLPHQIILDLGIATPVVGLRYTPRQDELNFGRIVQYQLFVGADGVTWGSPVSSGTLPDTGFAANTITFAQHLARYVKLVALSDVGNVQLAAAAELTVLVPPPPCLPVDLPGATVSPGTTTWTDPAVPSGGTCYSVVALYASGRSDPNNIPCTVITSGTLPAPQQTTLTPTTTTMQVIWTAPVFDATTVPATALTGYRVSRRHATTGPWEVRAEVGSTVLTWTDPTPPQGTPCYRSEAVYGATGSTAGEATCGTLLPVPTRPAAQNLRVVVP